MPKLEFEWCPNRNVIENSKDLIQFVDTLPSEILQTRTKITVKLIGEADHIAHAYVWSQMAVWIRKSMYWRVKTITDKHSMHFLGRKSGMFTTQRHVVHMVLRAVGIADL